MASALAHNPQEALLWALSDLEENNFRILKFHLREMFLAKGHFLLARGELEGLSPVDLASRLISMYGAQEAVRVVLKGLKAMKLMELVDQLSHVCLNDYREIYQEHVRYLEETREGGVNSDYTQVLLVAMPSSEGPGAADCLDLQQDLDSVKVEALFGPGEKSYPDPSLVVLQGSAGTGKTTLVRKMMLDWADGKLFTGQFDYVFYVSCREVVLIKECCLENLIFWCCGDNEAPVREILKQPERLLFILDGFDELQRPFKRQLKMGVSSREENMLHLLIRRRLLPRCSLLITTRPPALQNLESMLGPRRHVHILGFSEEERRNYFSIYFKDEEQARNAFDFVKGNDVLYKACQVPGICWMVCSWLKGQREKGQEISESPGNSTDIFTAYVSTFLPKDDNGDCSELTRHRVLSGLCSLATEGIHQQRFLFKEVDLRKHNLDASRLAAFLSSYDYQEGLAFKKLYSFRHVSFQEFFHAMSYLVKGNQGQLGKESRREVDKLLEVKEQKGDEEMTLSMQFLFDILKKESFLSMELKFCFKIAPSVKQDLMNFKEQMESIKHNRTWELEFSLYDAKIKNFFKGFQLSDITVGVKQERKHSNEGKQFFINSSLDKKKEEQKCHLEEKGAIAGIQRGTSNRKSRGTEEIDQEVRRNRMGSREEGVTEMKGEKDGGVEDRRMGKDRVKSMKS